MKNAVNAGIAARTPADVAQLRWLAGCWELRTPTRVTQSSGGPPTALAATFVSDTAVRFENPQHDFPQGMAYRRAGSDSLVASIDGPSGGAPRTLRFPMRRTSRRP